MLRGLWNPKETVVLVKVSHLQLQYWKIKCHNQVSRFSYWENLFKVLEKDVRKPFMNIPQPLYCDIWKKFLLSSFFKTISNSSYKTEYNYISRSIRLATALLLFLF